MQRTIGILFLALIALGSLQLTPAEVTNEDLRGTLQSLIHSYNQLDNKLERHEHRERALGELMKKAMQTLQKGQKNLEPINGIFGRLDERVSQIETMLIAQEDKYNTQTEKLQEAVEQIYKWMLDNNECLKRPPVTAAAITPTPLEKSPVFSEFVQKQEKNNNELVKQLQQILNNLQKVFGSSEDMMEQQKSSYNTVLTMAAVLTKIEDKLADYSVATTPAPEAALQKEFEKKLFEIFDNLQKGLNDLREATSKPEGLSNSDKEFLQSLSNETLSVLSHIKESSLTATQNALAQTTVAIKESTNVISADISNVSIDTTDSRLLLRRFYDEMNATYTKLNEGLEIVNKFNSILMINSETVLDTQRKVEFGTISIIQKIGLHLEKQREEILELTKTRFDSIDESIVNTQLETMQNLSSLIESETSNVWHQIAIMQNEISETKDLLGDISGRNDMYLNNTYNFMDNMGGKVQAIKERMLDMDSNLNFLLGKLSVMSQEFQNIKLGLAESLEQLRNTFHTMQEQVPAGTSGAGPHNIAKNEYETELNLLQKRHTSKS